MALDRQRRLARDRRVGGSRARRWLCRAPHPLAVVVARWRHRRGGRGGRVGVPHPAGGSALLPALGCSSTRMSRECELTIDAASAAPPTVRPSYSSATAPDSRTTTRKAPGGPWLARPISTPTSSPSGPPAIA